MKLWNRHTMPKDLVYTYIGRGTPWGNPFVVSDRLPQGAAADSYRCMLAKKLAAKDPSALKLVHDLVNVENIVCSCTPRKCHGDSFVEIWNLKRDRNITITQAIALWLKSNGYPYEVESDGIDHINIYSKGATDLGRSLSNLANLAVEIPDVGIFKSLEGYWYYLSTGSQFPELMSMGGFEAKKYGRTKPRVAMSEKLFKDSIKTAMRLKVEQHPDLKKELINSSLPFTHYYVYGNQEKVMIYPQLDWINEEWEYLRKLNQGRWVRCIIAGSRLKHWGEMPESERYQLVCDTIKESGYEIDEVISGGANGIDLDGERWGHENGKRVTRYEADWDTHGKKAGIMRNIVMGENTDRGIVLIKAKSRGSEHMANYLESHGKPCYARHVD